jgi:VanZ family protein
MKLSKLTIFIGLYIILSASFAQQLWSFAGRLLGKTPLLAIVAFFFIALALFITYKSIRERIGLLRIVILLGVCALAFTFAWRQPYMAEKTHILEYGILAWMALRDLDKNKKGVLKSAILAFIFAALVGVVDEAFQKLLPWRVFEVRDMLTNALSAALGIAVYLSGRKARLT